LAFLYIKKANIFYKSIGMETLILKKEVEGYLSDRLQESMWRESLHLIKEGFASTKDLDKAIIHGPGLRWSLMGTFLTFHLAGGKTGMRHMLEHELPGYLSDRLQEALWRMKVMQLQRN
jgi:carnitine 3-dehydrogenase